jgi:protein-tyrosine phosphatase
MSISLYEHDVTEIVPNLWLGNYKAAYDYSFLSKYKINIIITIRETFDNTRKYPNIKYLTLGVKDVDVCNINLIPIFENITTFIYNSLKSGNRILIHCKRGHHRSATIIAAYLIKYLHYDYNSAIKYIKQLRPCAFREKKCILEWLYKYYVSIHKIDKY